MVYQYCMQLSSRQSIENYKQQTIFFCLFNAFAERKLFLNLIDSVNENVLIWNQNIIELMWNDKVKYNISFENIFQAYKDVVKIFILNLALFSL